MGKKKSKYELDDIRKFALKGAVAVKSTDLIRHARDPVALGGDVSGFVGIGTAGAMSEASSGGMDMIYGTKKKRRKKKKR